MKSLFVLICAITLFASSEAFAQNKSSAANMISNTVVINEVYGGAGCGTAGCSTYQNDFIELRNISAGNVNITGWSVQYAAATGTSWQVTAIPATVLRPGDTFLIAQAFGANGVTPLPTPNVTGTVAMSAVAGKIALVNNSTALTGTCPFPNANIIDFVGYGATANCNDGGTNNTATNAPAPSTTTSVARTGGDTDVNSADFAAGAPTPQPAQLATASAVSISGRILTVGGRGVKLALVTLTDQAGNAKTTLSSPLGYYDFQEIRAGETYTVSVSSKGNTFSEPFRVISLQDAVDSLNFTTIE